MREAGEGEKNTFLNPQVCSSEQWRIQSSHSHDGGMKKREEMQKKKAARNHWCVTFSASLPSYTSFSLCSPVLCFTSDSLNSICCYFCIVLAAPSLVPLSLSVSLFLSGCQDFGVVRTNQAQPCCNYCQSDCGRGRQEEGMSEAKRLANLKTCQSHTKRWGKAPKEEQVRQERKEESSDVN